MLLEVGKMLLGLLQAFGAHANVLAVDGFLPTFFAQVTGPGGGGGGVGDGGAISHLIPATIQTAGVYAQASVLKEFAVGLDRIAALCYLAALCAAIASVAIYGSYQRGLYFLVGPSLFFFMVKNTANVDGTQLKMGNNEVRGSVQDQLDFLRRYGNSEDYNGQAKVSYFFLAYDKLVSSIVQDVVGVLVDAQNKEDIIFKAREHYLAWALESRPTSPGFLRLVSTGYVGACGKYFHMIADLMEEKVDPRKRVVTGNLNETGKRLLAEYNKLKTHKIVTLDAETLAFVNGELGANIRSDQPISCEEVWTYVAQLAKEFAQGQLDINKYLSDAPKDSGIPWDKVQEEVKKALSGKSQSAPEDILAAYIIKSTLAETSHQASVAALFEKVPFNAERHATIYEDVAGTELFGGYVRIAYFAASIPYIQGLLLYILSLSFPFFAIFLVMPGRATTFFIWMSLWAWVKSWDIGFAMVHVARKVMWQFVVHSTNAHGETVDLSRPETVFSLIGDNDPLAHENTYFQIVALLMTAIPLLSAHFCLGATNLYGAFRMAIDQTAAEFGTATARAQRRKVASEAESYVEQRRHYAGLAAANYVYTHPMTNKEGNSINDNGDNSLALRAKVAYDKAVLDWDMSEEGMVAKARLSALTTRTSNFYYGHGGRYLQAYSQYLSLSFVGVEPGGGNNLGQENAPVYTPAPGVSAPGIDPTVKKE